MSLPKFLPKIFRPKSVAKVCNSAEDKTAAQPIAIIAEISAQNKSVIFGLTTNIYFAIRNNKFDGKPKKLIVFMSIVGGGGGEKK
jgi:hypothetical protein